MTLDLELIEQLTCSPGVSGGESAVRAIIRERIRPLVNDLHTDALGNLIARKKAGGRSRKLTVMLAAHMDEVGLMLTFIDKSGYLRFAAVGGVDGRVLLAKRVLVGRDRVPGVIGSWPVHLLRRRSDLQQAPSADDLVIDIGAATAEEAGRHVGVGDYAVFDTLFEDWGPVLKAKAFDDRIGCYILIELLKGRHPVDITAAFTTQEEVGLRGAAVAAYSQRPDIALVLDATPAADFPGPEPSGAGRVPRLGQGPVITIMDSTAFCDRRLVKLLADTAKRLRIPVQYKRPGIGGTDAGQIHLSRGGVRTAVMAIPNRYIHSPATLVSKQDVLRGLRLLRAVLAGLR